MNIDEISYWDVDIIVGDKVGIGRGNNSGVDSDVGYEVGIDNGE